MDKNVFIKNSLNVLLLRVSGIILMFLLSLFLTNSFSAETVGEYDFVRSTLMILSGASLLGTNQAIIYYSGILTSKKSFGSIKSVYFKMNFLILIACAILYVPMLIIEKETINQIFNKQGAYELINFSLQGLVFYSITMLNIDTIRALKHTLISEAFRNLFRYTPFFVFSVILYIIDKPEDLVVWFIYSFILLFVISTIVVFFLLFKKGFSKNTQLHFSSIDILKTSYPMALSAISYFLMQSTDVLFISAYDTFESVAYYSIAVKLATVTALALISVNIVIAPKIASIYNDKNFSELKLILKKATRINVLISLPIIILLLCFSEFVLSMFGTNYIFAKNALWVLLFAQFFNSITGPSALYLNMTGRQKKLNVILLISLIINIILNILLVPDFGIFGAAIATTTSFVLSKVFASALVFYLDNVKTFIS
ncbi:MATE family efflux transporter [Flavobacteriaceae bacterium]|jgi:O-antigen/teichoic acid export membrane protein|nr:MATE family efflux transporter [Flavobacteriaceae bacterium]MDA9284713.1 MATE family efflux transporter [Flavobacteriaceae bacterium]MDB4133621.1 MATE family efflux transporter [Flavobacteriaceae bacterium]MDC0552313.1 MATE family efflux transporter [Flavobacteriaceae bacterium]MDC0622327.1 MATE family efflux transporter [Flavobacteriaceae bacterium]|tara:strand:+ start:884 stop:2164 length:1281 start_codon:yes stop_codon:yes gene_type:complete